MLLSRWPTLAQMAISAFLLLTAVLELFDTMLEDMIGTEISTAHGLFVFAIAKILKEGLEVRSKFSETREKLLDIRGEASAAESQAS